MAASLCEHKGGCLLRRQCSTAQQLASFGACIARMAAPCCFSAASASKPSLRPARVLSHRTLKEIERACGHLVRSGTAGQLCSGHFNFAMFLRCSSR